MTAFLVRPSLLLRSCLGVCLFSLALASGVRADSVFKPLALGSSGLAGDGIALFLPAGLKPDAVQSVCLVSVPTIHGAIPPGWRDVPAFSSDGTQTRAELHVDAGTDLYGTGEVTGPLLRNGHSIELWNTDNFTYLKHGGRRLYQSHPWVLGVRADGTAFGVIFDSTWKASLSCSNNIVFTSDGPAFPVFVIERSSPAGVLRGLADLTGTMPMPPLWALGYQQCRWSYYPATRVKEIADGFRSRHIPCDVIWMDIDYMDGFRIFTFDKKGFPHPAALNAYLHRKGFHSVWMIDPGVKREPGYEVYDTGTAANVWVKTRDGHDFVGKVWPGDCVFPDFTRPGTQDWWATQYKAFLSKGVDGVWNDMNEPSVFGGPDDTMPVDNHHRGGGNLEAGPHLEYHNVYGMLMARTTRAGILDARPDKRPFVLTRSNFLGGQRYAATWTGDNASTEVCLRESIPMSLNLGLSGQPFNGPDLGGFADNATPDLWARWVGFGAFFPFCRGHAVKGSNNKEPWAFGPVVEKAARIALERRYRLLPYYYTLFHEASVDGMPVMRPLFMADPKDLSLRSEDQAFLIGSDLLVVPQWAKHPALPKGTWRQLSLVRDDLADPFQAKLLVRAGSIIPIGRVVENTNEKLLSPLTLVVCLDAAGKADGRLYEDAGNGYGYQHGDYLLTTYHAELHDGRVVVSIASATGRRERPERKAVIEVLDAKGQHIEGKVTGL